MPSDPTLPLGGDFLDLVRVARERGLITRDQMALLAAEYAADRSRSAHDLLVAPGLLSPAQLADLQSAPALRRVAKYEILSLLGEGAMGAVYEARDASLGRLVALKILRADRAAPALAGRFLREAQNAARLQHPGIVTVYECGQDGDRLYIAMERVEGETLGRWAGRARPSVRTAAAVVEQAARAVHAAHERGIVHRDIKPSNILVDARHRPHLVDFGLSHALDGAHDLTRSGAIIGTPNYMPPEQIRGGRLADARSDVWSLGVILYELAGGRLPFAAPDTGATYAKILTEEPPSPRAIRPGLPAELEAIILRALEKEPPRRYASALDLADDLKRWLDGEPVHARPPSTARRLARAAARRGALIACLAALAIVAAGIGVAARALGQSKRAEEDARRLAERTRSREEALKLLELARPAIDRAHRLLYVADSKPEDLVEGLDQAQEIVARAAALAPDLAAVHHLAGRAWEIAGWDDRAVEAYRRAVAVDPAYAPARYRLGRLFVMRAFERFAWADADRSLRPLALEDVRDASREIEAALAGSAGFDDPVQRSLAGAMVAYARREYDRVREIADAAIAEHAGREGIEDLLLLSAARPEGALVDRVERAIERRPKFPEALTLRSVLRFRRGDVAGALQDASAAIALRPRRVDYLLHRLRIHSDSRDLDAADRDVARALELEPGNVGARLDRANLMFRRGDARGALAELDRLVLEAPHVGRVWRDRGIARSSMGDYREAHSDLDRAIELDPEDAMVHYDRGLVRVRMGRFSEAIADFSESIRLDPACAEAIANRGGARMEAGDLPGARADLDDALRLQPRNGMTWLMSAVLRFRTGDRPGRRTDLLRAVELLPQGSPAWRRAKADLESLERGE